MLGDTGGGMLQDNDTVNTTGSHGRASCALVSMLSKETV